MTIAIGGTGAQDASTYYGDPVNFGNYQYISIDDVINNFTAAYTGEGKILPSVLAGDISFHAYRALQELNYDTLRSVKSLEMEVCPSLVVPLPHDFVNHVKLVWSDASGVERVIYPARHTSNPFAVAQDESECDDCGDTSNSYTFNDDDGLEQQEDPNCEDEVSSNTWDKYKSGSGASAEHAVETTFMGKRYGLDPQFAQANGSYYIDYANGTIHFGGSLSGKTITIKYISDGVDTEGTSIVPKLAEEAIYKWIAYGCASARTDVPEGVIQRLKRERFAETRKAKLRLSNIKIEEITQIMRGKSKMINH
jgi:hypothetical protein